MTKQTQENDKIEYGMRFQRKIVFTQKRKSETVNG